MVGMESLEQLYMIGPHALSQWLPDHAPSDECWSGVPPEVYPVVPRTTITHNNVAALLTFIRLQLMSGCCWVLHTCFDSPALFLTVPHVVYEYTDVIRDIAGKHHLVIPLVKIIKPVQS